MSAIERVMRVDKSLPQRAFLCKTCEHEKCADDVWPCSGCWNPVGDMYHRRKPAQEFTVLQPILKNCPLCNSNQVQLCSDSNNSAKDQCKCRECGCTALRSAWNKDRRAAQLDGGQEGSESNG